MTLSDIRKRFVKHSGRYDLVVDTDDWEDDGANHFIRSGQKLLDQLLDTPKTKAVHTDTLSVGQTEVRIPGLRSPSQVWIVDDGENKFLDRIYFADFKDKYGDSVDNGVPIYYTVVDLRTNLPNKGNIIRRGILIAPPPNDEYQINVRGKFFSAPLTNDESFSFWTLEYPDTLVQAAMYELEKFYRNTQGMNDHMNAIQLVLNGIDNDQVEVESEQQSRMSDSFNERGDYADRRG